MQSKRDNPAWQIKRDRPQHIVDLNKITICLPYSNKLFSCRQFSIAYQFVSSDDCRKARFRAFVYFTFHLSSLAHVWVEATFLAKGYRQIWKWCGRRSVWVPVFLDWFVDSTAWCWHQRTSDNLHPSHMNQLQRSKKIHLYSKTFPVYEDVGKPIISHCQHDHALLMQALVHRAGFLVGRVR
jgi:hypothetical protein